MASYFRNLFGSPSNQAPGTSSSKTHSRSRSAVPNGYLPSGSGAGHPSVQRSHSYTARAPAPSPLRPSTAPDTRTAHGYGRRGSHGSHADASMRPQVLRREAQAAGRAPIYASGVHLTPTSSRSNSSSSIFTGMGSMPYVTSASDSGHHHAPHHDARTPLRAGHNWHPGSSAGSASSFGSSLGHHSHHSQPAAYVQPRATNLHMHPLLAYTRLHRAPITYDVTFTPSARTVLDRATHSAIPSHTLSQPATDPPTPNSSRLVLRSHKFPWPVVVGPSGPRFTIGPSKRGRGSSVNAITNLDVLYAVHSTLLAPVTPEEWEALGHGSRKQQKVSRAYEKRCTRMGGGWEGGVRRIDWLGDKTRLIGVEVDKSAGGGGMGKLVFGKA